MLTGADIQALKDYVTAPGNNGQNQAESTVKLSVTHQNLKATFIELRLDLHLSVDSLKHKLTSHCGTPAADMVLQLKDSDQRLLCTLADDCLLGYYSPRDGYTIHILDNNPCSASAHGWLDDVSKVKKYQITEEAYNSRDNTYRKYKEAKRQQDPAWTAQKELCMRRGVEYATPNPAAEKVTDPEHMGQEASALKAGDRCQVDPGAKRGTIRFVGKCQGLPLGYWVGVEYDEPVGKHDGSVKGVRYFGCREGYGSMIRPNLVSAGDFPPLDDFAFSDDDEI